MSYRKTKRFQTPTHEVVGRIGTLNPKRKSVWNKLHHKYGITESTFNELFDAQDGMCLLCGRREIEDVDHDATDKFRGLICHKCNSLLRSCERNVDLLTDAIEYLNQEIESQ
jgi:hypothetical protein